jgi:hypothetical protein
MTKKPLSEQQQKFIELLFLDEESGGAGGDFVRAKKLAGYHPTYSTRNLVALIKDEIVEATKNYMVQVGPKAAMKITRIMDNPTDLGSKEALAAAKELLDRGGVGKAETLNIGSSGGGILILPAKKPQEEEE